jgi:hypothetical protein
LKKIGGEIEVKVKIKQVHKEYIFKKASCGDNEKLIRPAMEKLG